MLDSGQDTETLLEVNNIEVIYNQRDPCAEGRQPVGSQGRYYGIVGRQRCGQDDHAEGHLKPLGVRAW